MHFQKGDIVRHIPSHIHGKIVKVEKLPSNSAVIVRINSGVKGMLSFCPETLELIKRSQHMSQFTEEAYEIIQDLVVMRSAIATLSLGSDYNHDICEGMRKLESALEKQLETLAEATAPLSHGNAAPPSPLPTLDREAPQRAETQPTTPRQVLIEQILGMLRDYLERTTGPLGPCHFEEIKLGNQPQATEVEWVFKVYGTKRIER